MEGHAVATSSGQSKFCRLVSVFVLGCLIASGSLARDPVAANPGGLQTIGASGYQPVQGEPFFLLSDASWGSTDIAQVRVEVPGAAQQGELANYGGVDVVVYRVPKPLEFLQQQKNLHRPNVKGRYAGEGLANTLTQVFDRWYKESRRAWQRILSFAFRKAATETQPQLAYGEQIRVAPQFGKPNPFKPLEGFEMVASFRYPVMRAQPIQPPKDVKLPGSSSDFMPISAGNVMVPLGKLTPGLYLVEGIVGAHRANTLVFVSDTQAITKTSGGEMLVWTADRSTGKPVAGATLRWTDGVGLLASADTDRDGIARMSHVSPERAYLIGEDAKGGVFVSENFYYDAEIYNTKLYAFTDRPLYRPGDEVMLKVLGREFTDARNSKTAQDAEIDLDVFDANGTALFSRKLAFKGEGGADTRFRLPANAPAGGYDIRIGYRGDQYGAAFRVAEYIKPHFDINLLMDKQDLRTNEAITGKIRLTYPDGKPVANARLTLSVRAQQITMVDGEMQYAGQFPIKLEQQELKADGNGVASLKLPPATDPSRYAVTVLASDGAAYRVKITREFLVERGANPWKLTTSRHFTQAGESVDFALQALGEGGNPPARWEALRLESREKIGGDIAAGAKTIATKLTQPGSYTVSIRDAKGNLLGATSHWVAGNGMQATPGSVEIVLDRDRFKAGDTAEALVTFPVPVQDALLTLERDSVEQHALLSRGADWVQINKLSPTQWKLRIPVRENFSPNITFSVLYTQGADYVFANAGLVVEQPALALDIKPEKASYQPGETVNVDITSSLNGKGMPSQLVVSVVDEMIYVLQPEIAPPITEFFYHVRRNNVRTAASLSFITYDMARSYSRNAPAANRYAERGVKVLERPRRDDVDTAAWQPKLMTDANGKARLSFVMPDSLTRWRISVRATNAEGVVGQKTQYVLSDKAAYVKWTGPRRFRGSDQPILDLVIFNRGQKEREGELVLAGAGLDQRKRVTLAPGPNFVNLPVKQMSAGAVNIDLLLGGKPADKLVAQLDVAPGNWPAQQQKLVALQGTRTPLQIPAGARNVQVSFASGAAQHFMQVADDLIDYPWGCVEQTASRLIPLSLAYQTLPEGTGADSLMSQPLTQLLQTQRQRLVSLAGPDAVFGWWGYGSQESAFLTGYAYYADWYASKALGIKLPTSHWENLIGVYSKHAAKEPVMQRALLLWWMRQMGLPVQNLLLGVEKELDAASAKDSKLGEADSVVMAAPESAAGLQVAELIVAQLRRELAQPARPAAANAANALRDSSSPFVRSLLLLQGQAAEGAGATDILASVSSRMPTLERAMTLVWLQKAAMGGPTARPTGLQPEGWTSRATLSGRSLWRWEAAKLPEALVLKEAASASGKDGPVAVLRYELDAAEPQRLPVGVQRRLYRLVADGENLQFRVEALPNGAVLSTDQLYIDEVELTPKGEVPPRYGIAEVPLPPGADVEATAWGLQIKGLQGEEEGYQPLRRLAYQMGALSYGVPVEVLDKTVRVRQLVRFGTRGKFNLPPARFYRMYQPTDKAFQNEGKSGWQVVVE
ncbi:MAG: alpha-2-macroglobulin family protein [Uliginosibacterium sp.]|nr:alpha-2-macroglobulin family protein [Uliginosibacterium sp.]